MIYFLRHGQTDANVKIYQGLTAIEHLDTMPLNATGREQAAAAAEKLKGTSFDMIISSPYTRALETAEIVNRYYHLPILTDDRLRERRGNAPDLDLWHDSFNFDNTNPGFDVEPIRDFFTSVYSFLDELKARYPGQNILIVSHGGVNHALYAYFNHLPWAGNLRIDHLHNADTREYHF